VTPAAPAEDPAVVLSEIRALLGPLLAAASMPALAPEHVTAPVHVPVPVPRQAEPRQAVPRQAVPVQAVPLASTCPLVFGDAEESW
jgi:hypothetical protein